MEIYTSYFSKVKSLPKDIIPIAICGGIPFYWKGLWYKKLAPRIKFFTEWKQNHDNDFYIEHFNAEVLANHTPDEVVSELFALANGVDKICLICYEKPGNFCHRHLVADWLNATGKYNVQEWVEPSKEKEVVQDELAIG
jgi:hypothetical protein